MKKYKVLHVILPSLYIPFMLITVVLIIRILFARHHLDTFGLLALRSSVVATRVSEGKIIQGT